MKDQSELDAQYRRWTIVAWVAIVLMASHTGGTILLWCVAADTVAADVAMWMVLVPSGLGFAVVVAIVSRVLFFGRRAI